MTELTKPDLVTIGLERLPSFWDDKPKATGLLKSFLQAFQNPLDLIFEILNGTSLYDAEGVQLDIIGKLWATSRESRTDEDYRLAISQAITNSTVDSTPERIYEVMKVASNATQLELIEYHPNIYLYLNVGVIESLKELALTTKAASVDISLVFPPIEDGKSASLVTAFDHSSDETAATVTPDAYCTTTPVLFSVTGLVEALEIEDADITFMGSAAGSSVVRSAASENVQFSVFIKKDLTPSAVSYFFIGNTGAALAEIRIDIELDTGNYLVTNEVNLTIYYIDVMDLGDYFHLTIRYTLDDILNINSYTTIIPARGPTLGSFDPTSVGTITVSPLYFRPLPDTEYNHILQDKTGLRCSNLLSEKYNLIDGVGDFIIDDVSDFIKVESGFIYLNNAKPLGRSNNIKLSQPCTVVI